MIKKTPLRKISKKRKERLSGYSEKDLFFDIRKKRRHNCEICGKYIPEPMSWCFAHMLPKGTYPKYRVDENNISIVCSIGCHGELDKICAGKKYLIEKSLANAQKILIDELIDL